MSQSEKQKFDAFFAYNSADRNLSEEIADRLRSRYGLRVWLDAWRLPAGESWRPTIIAAIGRCRSFAAMFGSSGWGKNQVQEVRQALQYIEQSPGFRIVPVLLPGADETKIGQVGTDGEETDEEFRIALVNLFSAQHRIDFRSGGTRNSDTLAAFAAGILGNAPGPPKISAVTIEEDADDWNRANRMDKASLYRGHTLKRALELVGKRDDTSEVVRSFLGAARAHEQLRSRVLIGIVAAAMLIAGFAVTAELQRREANSQRIRAEFNAAVADRLRSAAQKSESKAHVSELSAVFQRDRAEAATKEANRLRGLAEAAQAKATKGRQALLTYLISEATGMPETYARGWAEAPTRRSSVADVERPVVEEWRSILSENLLQPQVLKNLVVGQTVLAYLSLPPATDFDYPDRQLLDKSFQSLEFQARLRRFADKAASILRDGGMSELANFYSPDTIRHSLHDQLITALLEKLLFRESQIAVGTLKAGDYVAQWRESGDTSPEQFRLAFAGFRDANNHNIEALKEELQFWRVRSTLDPEAAFRRIMSAAGKTMAGECNLTQPVAASMSTHRVMLELMN